MTADSSDPGATQRRPRGKRKKALGRVCETCRRDTKSPLFDGCMNDACPRGYEPCL